MYEFARFDLLNKLNRYFLGKLADETIHRSLPAQWSYMHLFSSVQIAKILCVKRGLDYRIALMSVAFHDVATIVQGVKENHAAIGETLIENVLSDLYEAKPGLEKLTVEELEIIKSAVKNHSDKHTVSDSPYDEFTKDVDAFDRYLHSIGPDEDFVFRVEKVAEELSLLV